MNQTPLYLASKSPSRKMLLNLAKIPFIVLEQNADEDQIDRNAPLADVVQQIALHKMESIVMPRFEKTLCDVAYVLTADTMVQDIHGNIQGKPKNREAAIEMIRTARLGSYLCTAFCIDKKVYSKTLGWKVSERIIQVVESRYTVDIPEQAIERYFQYSQAIECAGAIAIEDFGAQYLKEVRGSYTAIIGLPLFEVRQALEKIGFF